jgi:hypothetical protein
MRLYPGDLFPFKIDLTSLGMVETIDAVEQNRFPSAIRSDDGKDLTFFDFKTDIHQGLDTSKCHEDVMDFELNLFRDSHQRTPFSSIVIVEPFELEF